MNEKTFDKIGELRRDGVVLCLSGPSGVGKGTVIHALRSLAPELQLSVSMTTRAPRPGEREGIEYFFKSREAFEALLAEGKIVEYDEYVGNYYGTPLEPLEAHRRAGRDVVLDITVAGSLAVKRNYPRAVTVFLLPPSLDELEQRLCGRGTEARELIERRLGFACREMRQAHKFQYILVNREVPETAKQLWHILEAERHRRENCLGIEELQETL